MKSKTTKRITVGGLVGIGIAVAFSLGWFSGGESTNPSPTPTPSPVAMRHVTLSFYSPALDRDAVGNVKCSAQGLVPTARDIPLTTIPIQDTIRLLLATKPTSQEFTDHGLVSEFPLQGVTLVAASLNGTTLTLTFTDPDHRTSGGACFISILRSQVEGTAKQFSGVSSVRFMPADLFQP